MRRKLIDLRQKRTALLEGAEALLKEGKREEYRAEMAKVTKMNEEIKDMEDELQKTTDRFIKEVDKAVEVKSKEVMTV